MISVSLIVPFKLFKSSDKINKRSFIIRIPCGVELTGANREEYSNLRIKFNDRFINFFVKKELYYYYSCYYSYSNLAICIDER